jgi:type I restriction enzyme S subunit
MGYSLGEILGKKGYIRGPFGSALKRSEMLDKGIPVYEQQNAIYNNREFRFFISDDKFEKMKRFTVQEGDIIISCSGTVGKTTLIRENDPIGIISQALLILRPDKKKTDSRFLKYFLDSKEGQEGLLARAHGSVQTNIAKRQDVETLVIPELSLAHQKSIANILSSLDDKIELNSKINKNLEQLAQTLYKRWFVDFDFPNEDGEPYKSSGGEMVESELGLIPKGWSVKEQGEYFPVVTGKKNANVATNHGKFKFFTCSQEIYLTDNYSFEGDAILVAGNGDFNVKYYSGKFEAYQRTYVLIPSNSKLSGVLYFAIKHNLNDITRGSRGSVISFITKGNLENFKIAFPNIKALENYGNVFKNILINIAYYNEQNEKLSNMRDELLPKLMNGEIEVPIEE